MRGKLFFSCKAFIVWLFCDADF